MRQIASGSLVSIALRVAGVALSYAVNIYLSRILGLAGYGQYVVALGWALILVLPSRLGLDYSALRYATAYVEAGNWASFQGFVRFSFASIAIISAIMAIVMVGVSNRLTEGIDVRTLIYASAIIAPLAMIAVLSVLMRVARDFFGSQFYDQLLRPGLILVALGLLALVSHKVQVTTAMLFTTAAAWASLAALAVGCRSRFGEARGVKPDYRAMRDWISLSLPLLGVSMAQEILNQLEVIMLGSIADSGSAGLFAAASRLTSLMTFALVAFGIVSGPMVASAFNRRDFAELQSISTLTARLGLAFAAICAVVLTLGGKLLLGLFGPEFVAAYPALLILVAGGLVNAFTGVVVYLATLTGRERPAFIIFMLGLLLSFVLNMILIPKMGLIGAALSSTLALTFWNLAMLVYVRRTFGIDASALGLRIIPAKLQK